MARGVDPVAGQSVVVTGAARGIGAEVARRLSARGARVALVGLEPDLLREVADSCEGETAWFEADITDREALELAVAGAVERFRGIDVLVANAGVGAAGTVRSMDAPAWERVVEINLFGSYRTVRACLPHVIARHGYILVVASVSALIHESPGLTAYSASKAGVEAFANGLRIEVAHLGTSIGVAYFPWVDTDMVQGADGSPTFRELRSHLKGAIAKTQPVSAAADAIVKGVERRSARVVAPAWVGPMIPMRGVVARLADRDARKTAPEIVRIGEAESDQVGPSAYAPVGAGGAAALQAVEELRK